MTTTTYTVRNTATEEIQVANTWRSAVGIASRMGPNVEIIERNEDGQQVYDALGNPLDNE